MRLIHQPQERHASLPSKLGGGCCEVESRCVCLGRGGPGCVSETAGGIATPASIGRADGREVGLPVEGFAQYLLNGIVGLNTVSFPPYRLLNYRYFEATCTHRSEMILCLQKRDLDICRLLSAQRSRRRMDLGGA